MLAIARALTAVGHRPRHPLCFTSRTAEEYGLENSPFDWCIGAWRQVQDNHPEWAAGSPFHLCVEASGHPDLRLLVEAPAELAGWVRDAARIARREGWLTSSWRVAPPGTGTELWPLLVSGIPGISVLTWEKSFMRTDYHTPRDTSALLDFDHLERLTRFYAYLLLRADADPDAILDHDARTDDVAKAAAKLGAPGKRLATAARRRDATGRRGVHAVGRELLAVDAHGALAYPHAQAAKDAEQTRGRARRTGQAATAAAPSRRCARSARTPSRRSSRRRPSPATPQRREPGGCGPSWAQASHLTAEPGPVGGDRLAQRAQGRRGAGALDRAVAEAAPDAGAGGARAPPRGDGERIGRHRAEVLMKHRTTVGGLCLAALPLPPSVPVCDRRLPDRRAAARAAARRRPPRGVPSSAQCAQ